MAETCRPVLKAHTQDVTPDQHWLPEFDTIALDGENHPSARLLYHPALALGGRCTSYSCDIEAPRLMRSRMTMTGSRFPGSRVIASDHLPRDLVHPQWHLWSSAIRLQLRGQPRIDVLAHTHRIPLVSPRGHYRSQTWHRTLLRVNRRNRFDPELPSLSEDRRRQLPRSHTEVS